jgi:hypothetical protein
VAATGVEKPQIDLKATRDDLDTFVELSNKAFRKGYSNYRAAKIHNKVESISGAQQSSLRRSSQAQGVLHLKPGGMSPPATELERIDSPRCAHDASITVRKHNYCSPSVDNLSTEPKT